MTYIENVFLCMASPLLIAALCMGKRQRKFFLFCFAGMGVMSAFRIHQHLFCCTLQSGHLCSYHRDRPGGGGSDETSAIALLSADI